jgi:hypothetical protein
MDMESPAVEKLELMELINSKLGGLQLDSLGDAIK